MTDEQLAEIERDIAASVQAMGVGWCQECALDGHAVELLAEVQRLRAGLKAVTKRYEEYDWEGFPDDHNYCGAYDVVDIAYLTLGED